MLAAALVAGLALPALAATAEDDDPGTPTAAPTATATPDATPTPEATDPPVPPDPQPSPAPEETPEGVGTAAPTPAPEEQSFEEQAPADPTDGPRAAVPGATGSISGRITAPAGFDLTRVQVAAWLAGHDTSTGGLAQVASDGTYTVTELPPGRYMVEFLGWYAGLLGEYWNNTRAYDQATLVVVGSGPATGIDATLDKGATFSGRIRTSSDCDLSHVDVWAHALDGGTTYDSMNSRDGTWSLIGLAPGRYWVEFDGRYAGLDRVFWNTTGRPYQHSEVIVGPGQDVHGLDVTLNGPLHGCVPAKPFVRQVYLDLLGRDVDYSGLWTWANALALQGVPRAAVADAITSSDEYRSLLIRASYPDYLNRPADPGGVTTWLGQLRLGDDIEDIQAAFVASDEFWHRNGATGAGWITGLYRTVLGRSPADVEVRWWLERLASGASRVDVARGFLYSTEHLTTVVDGYYVDLLGRHIDPSGKATWVGLIQQGSRDEQIVAGILASEEFAAKVKRLWPGW